MRTIDLMIFDLDGTLVSSGVDLVNSVNYTLKVLCLPPKTEKEIISFVGDGVRRLIERALASQEESVVEKALAVFSDYYAQHLLDNTKLNPYALEVLENFADKIKVRSVFNSLRDHFRSVHASQMDHFPDDLLIQMVVRNSLDQLEIDL